MGTDDATFGPRLRYRSAAGRWVLLATVLGSGMAFLDATVVNIALPSIGRDLDAGLAGLQWTVNAYALTLAGLLLLGGALGDRYGRRRIFVIGASWFAVASLLCGLAPNVEMLTVARALQGVGGALLTPGSLAIIEASFRSEDRGAAVGAWSGLGGVAGALGPFVGGYLIDVVSWRLIFLINLPIAAAVVWVAARHVPESRAPHRDGARLDFAGVALSATGLALATYGLTEGGRIGWGAPVVSLSIVVAVVALGLFVARQRGRPNALVPLAMFKVRQFSAANGVTFAVYAALAGALFLLPIELQRVVGYSPLEAGAALVPMTVLLLLLSARAGRLAQRIGPRLPMSLGPLVAAIGLALLTRIGPQGSYLATVLPGVLTLGLGLTLTVAPLTSTVLTAGGEDRAGVSSAINNAVARVAGLVMVALIPTLAGISTAAAQSATTFSAGFRKGMWISAGVCAAGGLLAAITIVGRRPDVQDPADEEQPTAYCPLDAPPLRTHAS